MAEDTLDREFLDELLDGDKEFAEELFETYFSSADTSLVEAARMLEAGDAENVFRPFHTLKGASASVGLQRMQVLAREFEGMAKAGELSECQARMGELREAVSGAKALLGSYLDSL